MQLILTCRWIDLHWSCWELRIFFEIFYFPFPNIIFRTIIHRPSFLSYKKNSERISLQILCEQTNRSSPKPNHQLDEKKKRKSSLLALLNSISQLTSSSISCAVFSFDVSYTDLMDNWLLVKIKWSTSGKDRYGAGERLAKQNNNVLDIINRLDTIEHGMLCYCIRTIVW